MLKFFKNFNIPLIKPNYLYRTYVIRKRFYKTTDILGSDGKYEITLDQRKLKTPKGNLFIVDNKALALAVAQEWDAQIKTILQNRMHLTTLCNTVIDNPNKLTKYDMANYIVNYIDTDTILFQAHEDDDLYKFQQTEWDPIIEWFNKRFNVNIEKSRQMNYSSIIEKDKNTILKYILSYNFPSIHGFVYGVDTLKSVILTIACVERFITTEKAVLLSRLEEEYQSGHWGRIEWNHDLNQQDLQARLSAVILFIYFNTQSNCIQAKKINI